MDLSAFADPIQFGVVLSYGWRIFTEAIPAAVAAKTRIWFHSKFGGCKKKSLGIGFALLVVSGTNQGIESVAN